MIKLAPPPKHLAKESKKLWQDTIESFELEDFHLRLLQSACECWDRITEARTLLDKEGSFYIDRFKQPREHPAAKTERDNRIIHARLLRELGLDLADPDPPRPKR